MKKVFLKIPCEIIEEDETIEYVTKRRHKKDKNVRSLDYKDKHLLNMISTLSPQYQFARYLAESMNDLKSLPQYLKWVEQYPHEVLEDTKRKVLARKDIINRGGYFTVMLKHHEYNQKHNAGH